MFFSIDCYAHQHRFPILLRMATNALCFIRFVSVADLRFRSYTDMSWAANPVLL